MLHDRPFLIALASVCLFAAAEVEGKQGYPPTAEAIEKEISELPWETETGVYALPASGGTLRVPEGLWLLRDTAARRLLFLTQGTEFPDTELYLLDPMNETQAILAYVPAGYVTLDDWDDVKSDDLLRTLQANTAHGNAERRLHGKPPLRIAGWLQEPVLNKDKAIVHWSVFAYEDTESGTSETVNATALKLGRRGFERLTWVGTREQYYGQEMSLDRVVEAHQYPSGHRYADYTIGDNLAGFGIASLVAVTAGTQSKAAKSILAALLATVVVFLKKFIIAPIVLAFGAACGFVAAIRRKLRGG